VRHGDREETRTRNLSPKKRGVFSSASFVGCPSGSTK
jgi:hypothetical protein